MEALNKKERKKARIRFTAMFLTTFLLIFLCSFFVLRIAREGVKTLESKHTTYTKAFANQALVTFKIEEIIEKIYSLKTVDRTINEQKNLQGLISNIRMDIEKLILDESTELKEFELYSQLLQQVAVIQNTIDLFEEDEEAHKYNQDLLERCREKYREDMLGEVSEKDKDE